MDSFDGVITLYLMGVFLLRFDYPIQSYLGNKKNNKIKIKN